MSENISIIIPFYDHWELTHKSLMDLQTHVAGRVEIILVNDASKGDYDQPVGFWQTNKKHHIRYVKNKENLGFGGAMNIGAEYATGEYLIFLSNDVLIFSDFVAEIVTLLQRNRALVGGELLDYDTGWNVVDGRVIPYLNGWLLASTKDAWKEIGGFDLRYGKFDAEDIDLSLMFLEKGYNLLQLTRSKLQHLGGQTIRSIASDREEHTKKNIKLLHEKWNGRLNFLDNYTRCI